MAILTIILILIVFALFMDDLYCTQKTFIVQFQSRGDWSKDEWVENVGNIPEMTEFTTCHWEKTAYFASNYNQIWSYCSSVANKRSMKCIQLGYSGNVTSANRDVVFGAWFSGWTNENAAITFSVNDFRHRTWNHVCWSYSGRTSRSKFYYNGRMITADIEIENGSTPSTIEANDDISNYVFVIGQEPDSIRGGYSVDQAFYGSIAELNMWDKMVDDGEISNIANCKTLKMGNIISWDKKKLKINKAKVEDVDDYSFFCKQQSDIVIFPERRSFISALELCSTVDGKIVVPKSEKENKAIYDIAAMHKTNCIEAKPKSSNFGRRVWIGMQNFQWHSFQQNNTNKKYDKYTNWDYLFLMNMNIYKDRVWTCAYMTNDGFWKADYGGCRSLRLCPICSIAHTPIFTIKGLNSEESIFHWNYYLIKSYKHQIYMYESYKGEQKILFENNEWQMHTEDAEVKLSRGIPLLGRREWDWCENPCNLKTAQKKNLTISVCSFGQEFTCNRGTCIPIDKRCDGIKDCLDGSDEEQCARIDIPNSYEKINPPPERIGSMENLIVYTNLIIENINTIDMRGMLIGLTVKVDMTWKDLRLAYRNLVPGVQNLVSRGESEKLWLPLDHIVHENAIVGRIHKNTNRLVSIFPKENQMTTDIYSSYEELNFSGEDSWLQMEQRFRIYYWCIFDLTKYPFDRQQCKFIMNIGATKYKRVSLHGRKSSVVYMGRKIVSQFEIINTTLSIRPNCRNCTTDIEQNKFIFILNMKRNHMDAVKRIILPSFLLWIIAYLTLFIKMEDFTNRNRISITLLLTLITLFGAASIRDDFPITTYFKYIDIWFTWYLGSLFMIITNHILLAKFVDAATKIDIIIQPQSMTDMREEEAFKKQAIAKIECINNVVRISFLVAMVVFNFVYFYMTI